MYRYTVRVDYTRSTTIDVVAETPAAAMQEAEKQFQHTFGQEGDEVTCYVEHVRSVCEACGGDEEDYKQETLDVEEVSGPPTFNHLLDVCFTVVSEHEEWTKIPTAELIAALRKRADYLENNPQDAADAFGYSDTYKE